MTNEEKMQIAENIASRLFENGQGQQAQSLVLTRDKPEKRDLGGWSRMAVIDQIMQALDESY